MSRIQRQPRSQVLLWLVIAFVLYAADIVSSKYLPLLPVSPKSLQWLRIAADSGTHACIAGLIWISSIQAHPPFHSENTLGVVVLIQEVIYRVTANWAIFFLACFAGSLLDVDHFLAANSWTITAATHLQLRPFGHSVLFACSIPIGVYIGVRWCSSAGTTSHQASAIYWAIFSWSALFSHQLRDALRRGLWFYPLNYSSPPLSKLTVLVIYLVMIVAQYDCLSLLENKKCRYEEVTVANDIEEGK